MKKQSKSLQNKNKWKEISSSLRKKFPWCEVCGKTEHLQVHHAVSKFFRKSLLRFNYANLLIVCPTCHFVFHRNPVSSMEWFRKNKSYEYEILLNELKDNAGF